MLQTDLLAAATALCEKHGLLPHHPNSILELPYLFGDPVIHSLSVCLHELGHFYALDTAEQEAVSLDRTSQFGYINNLDYYIRNHFDYRLEWYNELNARAVQIGLNIVYGLWPSYDELTGFEFPETEVRTVVAAPKTAHTVIKIADLIDGIYYGKG